jgi:hypothetical protein
VPDPDSWPSNPEAVGALVALVVADIQEREPRDLDALLAHFTEAAWPTPRSQRQ